MNMQKEGPSVPVLCPTAYRLLSANNVGHVSSVKHAFASYQA